MFGLFKSKLAPEGPVTFGHEIEIARPVEEVYPLLDWADERNFKRVMGNEVTAVAGSDDRFEMVMPAMPDLRFHFRVTEAVFPKLYCFESRIEPRVGNLDHEVEIYDLEPRGESACVLSLITQVQFVEGLRMADYNRELAMMAASVVSALEKFKIQAEHGTEASRAVAERLVI